jgi:hypothetical protein
MVYLRLLRHTDQVALNTVRLDHDVGALSSGALPVAAWALASLRKDV